MKDLNLLDKNFYRALIPLLNDFKQAGIKYTVTSTYRSQAEQDELTEKGYPTSTDSNHLLGRAVDIWIEDEKQKINAAYLAGRRGFRALRYGIYKAKDGTQLDFRQLLHIDLGKSKYKTPPDQGGFDLKKIVLIGIGGWIGFKLFKRFKGLS